MTASSRRKRDSFDGADEHAGVRADWAIALRDLASGKEGKELQAVEALFLMADVLTNEERARAYDAIRRRFPRSRPREHDRAYLDALKALNDSASNSRDDLEV